MELRVGFTIPNIYTEFLPEALFNAGHIGAWFNGATYQERTGASASTPSVIGGVVGTLVSSASQYAVAAADDQRPLLRRFPAGGVRNLAAGAASPSSATYWNASGVVSGVTHMLIDSGIDTDGLPYATYTVAGTASAAALFYPYVTDISRTPAAPGQTWTSSCYVQLVAGDAPPAVCGVRLDVRGETAPTTYRENTYSSIVIPATETVVASTRTLSDGATNQVRTACQIRTESGATVNYTVKIKGLALEQAASRGAYQMNYTANDVTEAGVRTITAIQHDLADDALSVTLPDLGADAVIAWAETDGAHILTGQTVSGATTLPQKDDLIDGSPVYSAGPLTAMELSRLTTYLNDLAGV